MKKVIIITMLIALFFFVYVLQSAMPVKKHKTQVVKGRSISLTVQHLPKILQDYVLDGDYETNDSKAYFLTQVFTGIGICYEVNNGTLSKSLGQKYADICFYKALSLKAMQFDSLAWEESPIKYLNDREYDSSKMRHIGYLGYLNLLIAEYRQTFGNAPQVINFGDDISYVIGLYNYKKNKSFETYPGQEYITDKMVLQYSAWLNFKSIPHSIHGYAIYPKIDKSCTSGAEFASALYFLKKGSNVDKEIYDNFLKNYESNVFGYYGIQEDLNNSDSYYTPTAGYVVSGIGTVASGFTIGVAKLFDDKETFDRLYKSYKKIDSMLSMSVEDLLVKEAVMYAMLNS